MGYAKKHDTQKTSKFQPPTIDIQHSRCVLATTCILAFCGDINFDGQNSDFSQLLKKIMMLADMCCSDIAYRHMSTVDIMCMHRAYEALAMSGMCDKNDCDIVARWGVGMWCVMLLLNECINTCPHFCRDDHWIDLYKSVMALCAALHKIKPTIDFDGHKLYSSIRIDA